MLSPQDIDKLLREYVAAELRREMANGSSLLAHRVLGEVLVNKPGLSEHVYSAANALIRDLVGEKKL